MKTKLEKDNESRISRLASMTPEQHLERKRIRREYNSNPEVKERQRFQREKSSDKRKVAWSKWYSKNKDSVALRNRIYIRSQKLKDRDNQSRIQRRERDENFKLKCTLRSRVSILIKRYKGKKSSCMVGLLGCSVEFLRGWIESKFKPGMTWKNHGQYGWHIDHKIPCVEFDLRDESQQKICFNYTNLQPLWAIENLSKSDKLTA